MHVLITGGQGYIGNHLVKTCLNKGFFVTTIDNYFSKKEFSCEFPTTHLRRFNASVANPDIVVRALSGVDIIYHLASRSDHHTSYRHPARVSTTNIEGTTNLLCMAKRVGVPKIIFTSSWSVYGNLVGAKETDPCVPLTLEGCTKLAAENMIRWFYQDGMETVILRLFSVWGGEGSQSVIDKFKSCSDVIYGDGQQSRDFVHLDDVLRALVAASEWDSGIYNVGTGEESTINGIWSMIKGDQEPKYQPYPVGYDEPFRVCADMEYTKKATGWSPKVLLSEGYLTSSVYG